MEHLPQDLQDKMKESYVKNFVRRLEEKPEGLSKHEKRLGGKFKAARERGGELERNISTARDQIRQAEAQIRSMEVQLQTELGRASGLLESIVELEMMNMEDARDAKTDLFNAAGTPNPEAEKPAPEKDEAQPQGDLTNEDDEAIAAGGSDYVDPTTSVDPSATSGTGGDDTGDARTSPGN